MRSASIVYTTNSGLTSEKKFLCENETQMQKYHESFLSHPSVKGTLMGSIVSWSDDPALDYYR